MHRGGSADSTEIFRILTDEYARKTLLAADGSHRSEFETAFEDPHVEISEGLLSLTMETRDQFADNFTALRSDLRGED